MGEVGQPGHPADEDAEDGAHDDERAAAYFDPTDADDLAVRLADVLDRPEVVAQLRAAGPEQARRFSWARAGQEPAAVYARALAPLERAR